MVPYLCDPNNRGRGNYTKLFIYNFSKEMYLVTSFFYEDEVWCKKDRTYQRENAEFRCNFFTLDVLKPRFQMTKHLRSYLL